MESDGADPMLPAPPRPWERFARDEEEERRSAWGVERAWGRAAIVLVLGMFDGWVRRDADDVVKVVLRWVWWLYEVVEVNLIVGFCSCLVFVCVCVRKRKTKSILLRTEVAKRNCLT